MVSRNVTFVGGVPDPRFFKAGSYAVSIERLLDGRYLVRVSADNMPACGRSSREYFYDQIGQARNATFRQAFGWKAGLKY